MISYMSPEVAASVAVYTAASVTLVSGFRFQASSFRFRAAGFEGPVSGFGVQTTSFMVEGEWWKVQGPERRVGSGWGVDCGLLNRRRHLLRGLELRVRGFGHGVQGGGWRVQDSESRGAGSTGLELRVEGAGVRDEC